MLDIRFLRENPDVVKENIKKKFQDKKLPLVDEVIELDAASRAVKQEADSLRANRNKVSKEIGALMAQGKKDEAMAAKSKVTEFSERLAECERLEAEYSEKITKIMMVIPNIIDPSVPIGKDDSENVEVTKYGEPVVPDFDIPYHTDIMERFNGIDLDAARNVAGNGFYYLCGDIARLHSAVISYARDFMIDRGFTYCVPPFMIRSNVVTGVMSFAEMDAMMYKIEGEDLYLIGTSEHSMIGKYIDTIIEEDTLPHTLTSYSPCFRKEKGAHGIEERGVYRIHQFEKQEMIVVCKPDRILIGHSGTLPQEFPNHDHIGKRGDARLLRYLRRRNVKYIDILPHHLSSDQRAVRKNQPARYDIVLIFVKGRQIHGNETVGRGDDRRADRDVAENHAAIRSTAAHFRTVGRKPADLPSLQHTLIREELSGKQDTLPAEAGNQNFGRAHFASPSLP